MILIESLNIISFPLLAGMLAALAHVLSGPDHLAAVMPLAVENNKKAWHIGFSWALGHIIGMLLIGLLFMAFKQFIPVDKISTHSEALVGLVLIFIGLWSFYRIFNSENKHSHVHIHSDVKPYVHSHSHSHSKLEMHTHEHKIKKRKGVISAFLVGTIHGFAGISHFLIFLPAIGLKTNGDSIIYIVGFGIGTVVAMTIFALVVGKTAEKTKLGHNNLFFKGLRLAAGSFALLIGFYWLINNLITI